MKNTTRRTQFWHAGIVVALMAGAVMLSPARTPTAQAGASADLPAALVSPSHLIAPLAGLAAPDANGSLITCGESGNTDWTTTSTFTYQVIRQCTLRTPQPGKVFISANGSLALQDVEYEAQFAVGIDSAFGELDTDRNVNVYSVSGAGKDGSVAVSVLKENISAGKHTFYFLGRLSYGLGPVLMHNPSISVVFIPTGSQVLACGDSAAKSWTSPPDLEVIRQCSLTAPQSGWAFISADGSAGLDSLDNQHEYEARFSIGIDNTSGELGTDRYVNIVFDGVDGTDKSVGLSVLKRITTTGAHTFYFLGRLSSGSGPPSVSDPTLSVIFIPDADSEVLSCGASGPYSGTLADSFQVIRQCQLTVPQDGRVLLSADGWLAQQTSPSEAQFRFGIDDSTNGDAGTDRWVDVYNGYGAKETVALSVLKTNISAGTHTFYFLGRRSSGTGTASLNDPTLSVIFSPVQSIYVPLVMKSP